MVITDKVEWDAVSETAVCIAIVIIPVFFPCHCTLWLDLFMNHDNFLLLSVRKKLLIILKLFQRPIKHEKFVYSVSIQSPFFVVDLFYIYFYKHQ